MTPCRTNHWLVAPVRIIVLILAILPPVPVLHGQDYYVRHFDVTDGLPSSGIQSIFKDSDGLMWIGTKAALCTFDGKQFRVVRTPEGRTIDQVWAIVQDKRGDLWFGCNPGGIYRYDGVNFKRLTMQDGLLDNQIRAIQYSEKFDLIAACSYNGANIIRNDTIITHKTELGSPGSPYLLTGVADAGDYLYFSCIGPNNPIRYYPDLRLFKSFAGKGDHYPVSAMSIFITSAGDTIFGKYVSGLMIISGEKVIHEENIGQVFHLDEDRKGNLWMASWSYINRDLKEGVFRYDGKEFVNLQSVFGITDKEIWTVCCDRDQDLVWVGTNNDGLYLARKTGIVNHGPEFFGVKSLKINDLYVDSKNRLWIADNKELIRIDPGRRVSIMSKRPMTLAFREYWQEPNRLVHAQIDSIQLALRKMNEARLDGFEREIDFQFQRVNEDRSRTIFFSNRFGLFSYPGQSIDYFGLEGSEGYFEWIGKDTLILSGWGPTAINPRFREKEANIDHSPKACEHEPTYAPHIFHFNPVGHPREINRSVRRGDQIWYLSEVSGLWMSDGLILTHFNQADSTIHNDLNDLCFDESGHVFIASNSGEVYVASFDGAQLEILHRIGQQEGLQGSTANWLAIRGKSLWIGTNLGLHCLDLDHLFNQNEYRIRFFDKEDGYFGQGSKRAVINQDGQLFIATNNQLIEISTSILLQDPDVFCPLIISSLIINPEGKNERRIDGRTLVNLENEGKIRLKYTERNLEIGFDVLNYANPGKDLFRFKLSGYDKEWSSWAARRRANYTNLPPGRYEFLVESYNQGTLKSSGPLTVSFYVVTPFWRRWAFLAIVFILILAATILTTKYLVDRKRKGQIRKAEVESRILQLEMQALQAQMNPHFIYNCLGGIQYSVLENRNEQVLDYINDFSNVLRVSLENASQGTIRFSREVEFLHSYLRLEQMRFPDSFAYEIRTGQIPDKLNLLIPSMMIQPFAENSIKHGFRKVDRKGTLLIEFELEGEDTIRCTITDNGIGRAQNNQKPPSTVTDREHSTAIAEKRLQLYNEPGRPKKFGVLYTDLYDSAGASAGLKVELLLPVRSGEGFKRVVNS